MIESIFLKRLTNHVARRLEAQYDAPIILVGMHRSGTSLVTRLLREAGGYFGKYLEANSESIPFVMANNAILQRANMRWFTLKEDFSSRVLANDDAGLKTLIRSYPYLWEFFFKEYGHAGLEVEPRPIRDRCRPGGLSDIAPAYQSLRRRDDANPPFWGWKDPRNSLTLDEWLKIFPHARVIHIVRDGVDCALSLWRRSSDANRPAPCTNLLYCYKLWTMYTREALTWRQLGASRYLEIRYEDMLRDPVGNITELLNFAGAAQQPAEVLRTLVNSANQKNNDYSAFPELLAQANGDSIRHLLGYARPVQS